jgi:hypothetical protein
MQERALGSITATVKPTRDLILPSVAATKSPLETDSALMSRRLAERATSTWSVHPAITAI